MRFVVDNDEEVIMTVIYIEIFLCLLHAQNDKNDEAHTTLTGSKFSGGLAVFSFCRFY